MRCAYCGKRAEGHYSIHRDRFCEGPTVPLCDACGQDGEPTLDQIWAKIANPEPLIKAIKEANEIR